MLYVNDRDIVIPGQLLAENERQGENCMKENSKIYSKIYGMAMTGNVIDVISLKGVYVPRRDDVVIGVITGVRGSACFVNINSPYEGVMISEKSNDFNHKPGESYVVGDTVSVIVMDVDEVKKTYVARAFKIFGGNFIKINPKRVPRVIGKNKSMLNLIKEKSKSRIIVGQNGVIWISDGNVEKAIEIINFVEDNAYKSGLTDKVSAMQ
ncbi:MAG: hypothetical protein BWK75_02120 [Candidatus Altiarchaeales archaeon A3]|nr:MAG: hypothetical protein BWK75_02120 [Candidatus Altiarchaeales archaeon A3]